MTKSKATFIGSIAILLWALLALFTVGTKPMPAFQLNSLCFAIGGGLGVIWAIRGGAWPALKQVRWTVYLFGTLGLFGYHALYFSALRLAPAAEASLIAYLWPLLIVLFSGALPGESLRRAHFIGAGLGFVGAALLLLGNGAEGLGQGSWAGYALAGACALTWSLYSVGSRRLGAVPSETIAVFCILSAVLSFGLHLWLEDTVWPATSQGWAAVIGLGMGPVGLAFFLWDIGMKQGDIQILGVASYGAPLLSTLVLVVAGIAEPTLVLALAALLITGGALIAARASLTS